MQTNDTRQEYTNRLNRVINYIHANLDQPLSLNGLADVARFSPFHFHRIFKSLVGETLERYIQRARLEKAANLLLRHPRDTILDTAVACGFSSAAVFSRAFRAHFGTSPSKFRNQKKSNLGKVDRKLGKALAGDVGYNVEKISASASQKSQMLINIEVEKLPPMHVAYIRHIQGYRKGIPDSRIRQAFERIYRWASARDLVGPGTLVLGIPYDNPDITPEDRCRYDACITIPQEIVASQGIVGIQDIPGGKYAVCRIEVGASEAHRLSEVIEHLYDYLYGEWLPGSGYQADDKPPLELYPEPVSTQICVDYCIPVKPL